MIIQTKTTKMLDLSSVRRAASELQQKSDSGDTGNGSRSAKSLDNSSEEAFDENSHHNNPSMHSAASASTLLLQKAMLEAMMNKSASEKYETMMQKIESADLCRR